MTERAEVKGQRVRLLKNYVELTRKAIETAIERSRMRIFGYAIGAQSPVPVLTGDLRESIRVDEKRSPKGYATGLIIKWTAEYADILVQRGLAGTAHARTPGTTLLYPEATKPVFNQIFVEELRNALAEGGLTG
jgi:hypothetical protein